MTKPAIFSMSLMLAMSAVIVLQYDINAARREENALLRQRLAPDEMNQSQVEPPPAIVPSSTEDRSAELIRLRGEIVGLQRGLAETEQMTERDRTALAQAQASQTAAETVLKQTLKLTKERLYEWGYAWTAYAGQNQGQFPTGFEQARPFLGDAASMENDPVPSQFDIVYYGSLNHLDHPDQIVVLRQREPVQTPGNANWLRSYLFADGHAEIESTPDGHFEAWESQHQAAQQ